jgi:hypothetical protein
MGVAGPDGQRRKKGVHAAFAGFASRGFGLEQCECCPPGMTQHAATERVEVSDDAKEAFLASIEGRGVELPDEALTMIFEMATEERTTVVRRLPPPARRAQDADPLSAGLSGLSLGDSMPP